MEIRFESGNPFDFDADALIWPVFETDGESLDAGWPDGEEEQWRNDLEQLAVEARFTGKTGSTFSMATLGSIAARRIVLTGVGSRENLTEESIRKGWGSAVTTARSLGAKTVASTMPPSLPDSPTTASLSAAAQGMAMALYTYREYFGKVRNAVPLKVLESVVFVGTGEADESTTAIAEGSVIADGVNLARDLSNKPAAELTPARMAEIASDVAAEHGLEITIYGVRELNEIGANAMLTVGKGSANEPRLIHLVYRPAEDSAGERKIGLVGKCITFDTGGYSIKTTEGMTEMKGDMAGGAAVLGAMRSLAELGVPYEVHGVICAAENMISGEAFRPGDVITGMNGVTMEILSTDAEGRLVLADGLVFTARQGVTEMVDLATLTGAKVVALGSKTVALFSNNDDLSEAVLAAAETAGESMWRMPLSKHMLPQIKGDIADIRNSGGRAGGSITAALFLEHFCEDVPWAHLDIAGSNRAVKADSYTPRGATGVGVRTLLNLVRGQSEGVEA